MCLTSVYGSTSINSWLGMISKIFFGRPWAEFWQLAPKQERRRTLKITEELSRLAVARRSAPTHSVAPTTVWRGVARALRNVQAVWRRAATGAKKWRLWRWFRWQLHLPKTVQKCNCLVNAGHNSCQRPWKTTIRENTLRKKIVHTVELRVE